MRTAALLTGTALLAGCAATAIPPSAPSPVPPPAAQTPQPPPAPPPAPGWEDAALTSGDWTYESAGGASRAFYGEPGAPRFSFQCELGSRRILVGRPGAPAGQPLTLRTTYGARTLSQAEGGAVPAADPFLDDLVSSRGRFAVEAPDLPTLVVPTWPEPARVLEDCR